MLSKAAPKCRAVSLSKLPAPVGSSISLIKQLAQLLPDIGSYHILAVSILTDSTTKETQAILRPLCAAVLMGISCLGCKRADESKLSLSIIYTQLSWTRTTLQTISLLSWNQN